MQSSNLGHSENEAGQTRSKFIRSALITILVFAIVFIVLQRLTFILRFPPYDRTTIWVPGAMTFSALLFLPSRRWWTIYIGVSLGASVAYWDDQSIPFGVALVAAQFHFAAIALGVLWMRQFGGDPLFGNVNSLVAFLIAAGIIAPLATSGPIDILRWRMGADDVVPVAVRTFLCSSLGMFIATPAFYMTISHCREWYEAVTLRHLVELSLLVLGLLVVGHWAFYRPASGETQPAMLYAPIPLLLWAAMRWRLAGTCWALLLIAYLSTWNAIHGRGPFFANESADNVLKIQFFLMAMSLPLMFLAVVVRQRHNADLSLAQESVERKRMEDRFRLVVESSPNSMIMLNDQGGIIFVNLKAEKDFGYQREALIGQPIDRLIPSRFGKGQPHSLESYFSDPKVRSMGMDVELFGRRQDGSEFPVEIGLTPIQTSKGPFALCAIVDISERKRAEETTRELAHASRLTMLSEFTTSIAHEINQPLGAILSNADAAEMLLEGATPPLDEVRQILADIRKDDLRASEIIKSLRKLLMRGKLELLPVDINSVVTEVISVVRGESRRRNVDVQCVLDPELPLVRGHVVHLQQILLNLMVNAMDAMSNTQGIKLLMISTSQCNGFVCVTVSDKGPGIPPDLLPQLFERFFTTKKDGMGLGLSISKSLIEGLGGRIWAESVSGQGATFYFSLPVVTVVAVGGSESEPTLLASMESHP